MPPACPPVCLPAGQPASQPASPRSQQRPPSSLLLLLPPPPPPLPPRLQAPSGKSQANSSEPLGRQIALSPGQAASRTKRVAFPREHRKIRAATLAQSGAPRPLI